MSVGSHKETPILAKSGPKPLPTLTCIPRESIADTRTSSLGQLSDSTEPCALSYTAQPHRGDNRLCQSRYEQRNISQIGYSASIITKWEHLTEAWLAQRGWLTASMRSLPAARKRPCKAASGCKVASDCKALDPMEFTMYSVAICGRVASCSSVDGSSYQTGNNSSSKPTYHIYITYRDFSILRSIVYPPNRIIVIVMIPYQHTTSHTVPHTIPYHTILVLYQHYPRGSTYIL